MFTHITARLALLMASIFVAQVSHATPGISANEIRIGQSAALTGASAELGQRMSRGAQVYFDHINAQGGIGGRKIKLITRDDGYDPQRAAENTQALIQKDDVFALFGFVGTPTTNAALPIINAEKIPLIAPFTGANSLRNGNRMLFHIRASYQDEAMVIAKTFATMGINSINVLYQNDAYGKSGLDAMRLAAEKFKISINTTATVERNSSDVSRAVNILTKDKPASAIFLVTAYKSASAFISSAIKSGYVGLFANPSFVGSEALSASLKAELGKPANGVIISQVMPRPSNPTTPFVMEYQKHMSRAGHSEFDYTSIEGYLAAKLLVDGIRKAGPNLNRESLIGALEQLNVSVGRGMYVQWTPKNHNGSTLAYTTVINSAGQIVE